PAGARREALAPDPPAPDREPAAVDRRRDRRARPGVVVAERDGGGGAAAALPHRPERALARSAGPGVHRRARDPDGHPLRAGAGAAGLEAGRSARAEERAAAVGGRPARTARLVLDA